MNKLQALKSILKGMGSVVVAYSGGVDSTFLLTVAADTLGKSVLAVTATSATYPDEELQFSRRTTKALRVRHRVIVTRELNSPRFISNPHNRCYFCKKELFSRLNKIARATKIRQVIDASNASDTKDYRPGDKAKRELKVRSPLQEAGFSKDDIRRASLKLGLAVWDKPSLACLASRIPYGTRISPQILRRVNRAEQAVRNFGFRQVRVRHYDTLCRIEVSEQDIPRVIAHRAAIVGKLRRLGYRYVTVDLQGYRTGSMNEVL